MIALIDTSVLLRKLFGEPHPLVEWPQIKAAFASRLLLIELGRVIDRCRLAGQINDEQVVHLTEESNRILQSVEVIALNEAVLLRASRPMPITLGTLDAIHLATALELAPRLQAPLVIATHDTQLARAARASGFAAVGCS